MLYGLPVEVDDASQNNEYVRLEGPVFTKNFGPYKKGDTCSVLILDVYLMVLTEYNGRGIVREVQVKLSPR